jgi:glutamine cyclotransferase
MKNKFKINIHVHNTVFDLRKKFENSKSGVLNGIAYDVVRNRFLITGKNWEWMYWVNDKD